MIFLSFSSISIFTKCADDNSGLAISVVFCFGGAQVVGEYITLMLDDRPNVG